MTDRQPTETTNLDRYGHEPLAWSQAVAALDASGSADVTWFLGTVGPDGRPHAAGVGAQWHEGDLFFTSGPGARKSRNLAANPAATLSVHLEGIDLVFEGTAVRVTDRATLQAVAARYSDHGWPAMVEGDALTAPYSAPSAGPSPWHVYRLRYDVVFGVAQGATRWRFAQR
jgi:hypothetical protein